MEGLRCRVILNLDKIRISVLVENMKLVKLKVKTPIFFKLIVEIRGVKSTI